MRDDLIQHAHQLGRFAGRVELVGLAPRHKQVPPLQNWSTRAALGYLLSPGSAEPSEWTGAGANRRHREVKSCVPTGTLPQPAALSRFVASDLTAC